MKTRISHTEPQRKYSFIAEMLKYASGQRQQRYRRENGLAQLKGTVKSAQVQKLIAIKHMLCTNIIDQTEHNTVPSS
jgi:hypothetical protein